MPARARVTAKFDESHEYIDLDADDDHSSSESSDDTDSDNATQTSRNWPAPAPTRAPSGREVADLKEALRAAQLESVQLKDELRGLKIKYAELEQKYKVAKKKSSKESKDDKGKDKGKTKDAKPANSKISENDEVIALYGRRFGVMNEIWVTKSAFLKPRPPDVRSDALDRWETKESAFKGLIAELYEEIPETLHPMLEKTAHFRDRFRSALDANRRAIIYQLRTQTAGLIFGQNQAHYLAKSDRSTVFQKMINDKPDKKFAKFPPILFPDMKRSSRRVFANPSLPLMLRSILFGASSLSASRRPSTSTVGHLWGINTVTPGAVAFVAVVAIFLHSIDEKFEAEGHKSNIPYLRLFATYKEIIVTKLTEGNEYFEEIFRWYNSQIFKWFEIATGNEDGESDSTDIDEILNIGNLTLDDYEIMAQVDDDAAWDKESAPQIAEIDDSRAPGLPTERPAVESNLPAQHDTSRTQVAAGPPKPRPRPRRPENSTPVPEQQAPGLPTEQPAVDSSLPAPRGASRAQVAAGPSNPQPSPRRPESSEPMPVTEQQADVFQQPITEQRTGTRRSVRRKAKNP